MSQTREEIQAMLDEYRRRVAAGYYDDDEPMAPERKRELLALAGVHDDPAKLPSAIQKLVDHHVAITHRPASSHAYFDAEQAIRKAATTETTSRNRVGMSKLDEPIYKAAVREYCRRVEYPLPTGFGPLALSGDGEGTMPAERRRELLALAGYHADESTPAPDDRTRELMGMIGR